ncbi:hypothetical protein NUS47_11245, partial [Glaesserella parasuis]|nr:hypothetical protein [Glaesserella parasuis]
MALSSCWEKENINISFTIIVRILQYLFFLSIYLWGTDYFCIERKKKIWVEKMRWGFVWWGLPHFLLGGVMQKVK